jgi:uncharacterized protein (TIGR03437 family)
LNNPEFEGSGTNMSQSKRDRFIFIPFQSAPELTVLDRRKLPKAGGVVRFLAGAVALCLLGAGLLDAQGPIATLAGNGVAAYSGDGGPASAAALNHSKGIAVDAAGNVYIADVDNSRVRQVTPTGMINTVAGNGFRGASGDGGSATSASFSDISAVTIDPYGNLYVADSSNRRIRKVTPNGIVTTIAGTGVEGFSGEGGPAASAMLGRPEALAVDALGNLYFADSTNQRVRRIGVNGVITTVAGNGVDGFSGDGGSAVSASLGFPLGVAFDNAGNLYVADGDNNRIRRIAPGGIISTVAGNGHGGFSGDGGPATAASLNIPSDVAVDSAGNLYIADAGDNRVRKVDTAGIITTVAGTGTDGYSGDGGPSTQAMLNYPWGLAVDGAGTVYISDRVNSRVRIISGPPMGAPSIQSSAALNAASFRNQALAPGETVTLFGSNFALGRAAAPSAPLPTTLGQTRVTFNGISAPLFYLSPGQINAQVPFEVGAGVVSIQVTRGGSASAISTSQVSASSPGIFIMDQSTSAGAILHADFSLVSGASPARAGEIVAIYATGLGALQSPVKTGDAAPNGPRPTASIPTVSVGGLPAVVSYSGLAPGFVGLYQVNVTIPAGLQPGLQPVQINMGGTASNTATVATR